MATLKVKHKIKGAEKKLKLNEINELTMAVFIIDRSKENQLKERIKQLGAKIISITRGIGVYRNGIFDSIKIGTNDVSVFFVTTRVEDSRDLMQKISLEFELAVPGKGKGFTIDVDGYLGAKALFLED